MESEPELSFSSGDASLTIYDNRLELVARKRVQTVAFSDIAEVLTGNRPKRLVVVTVEGKRLESNIGRESEVARGAIERRLRASRS